MRDIQQEFLDSLNFEAGTGWLYRSVRNYQSTMRDTQQEFLDSLTFEGGTERLYRNVRN